MKLKYVLLSGLFLSATFVACTNDEFAEISTSVNTKDAIALGENYAINVDKAGAQTRSIFGEDLTPVWEKGDRLGAAWLHKVTAFNEDTYEVTGCSNIGTTYGDNFYSNHPFDLTAGENTNSGKFETVTNAFAGAYVLYYPYDNTVSMVGNNIPVKIKTYETDCKEGETKKAINENMFSYSPVKFVPGGNQTGTFTLKQVPVLFQLRFTATEKLNMDLANGIAIKNIVVIAKKTSDNVLASEGKIVSDKAPVADNYNEKNGKNLNEIVKYQLAKEADHLFITAKNSDNDDYKMLAKDTPTKKQFIFSILPFSDKADEVTIKVVTDKGVYAKTFSGAADKAQIDEFNNAIKEGGQVTVNVKLDVTELDNVIYTIDEFKKRWEAACASTTESSLEIGTPLELDEELACNDGRAKITVKGSKLTVKSMTLAKANYITFENELVVKEKLFTTGAVDFTAENLTAKTVENQGDAVLTVAKVDELIVASSGKVTLDGIDAIGKIGTIEIQKAPNASGILQLDAAKLTFDNLDSEGKIELKSNMTNKGNMTISEIDADTHTFTNEGIVTLNGSFTGTFANAAGATLNINGSIDGTMALTNAAADTDSSKPAAIVNISGASDSDKATVTTTTVGSKTITNSGIINVNAYAILKEGITLGLLQDNDDARINVAAKGKLELESAAALAKGYVVLSNEAELSGNNASDPIAFNLTATDNTVNTNATTVFVNCKVKASELSSLSILGKKLFFYQNIDLDQAMTCAEDVTIAGAVKVTTEKLSATTLTFTKDKANTIKAGASLTLSENVTIAGSADGTILKIEDGGTYTKGEGTLGTYLTVGY